MKVQLYQTDRNVKILVCSKDDSGDIFKLSDYPFGGLLEEEIKLVESFNVESDNAEEYYKILKMFKPDILLCFGIAKSDFNVTNDCKMKLLQIEKSTDNQEKCEMTLLDIDGVCCFCYEIAKEKIEEIRKLNHFLHITRQVKLIKSKLDIG